MAVLRCGSYTQKYQKKSPIYCIISYEYIFALGMYLKFFAGWRQRIYTSWVGYTLFANHNETLMKRKFHRKNCKFRKHNENCATHYSLIIQSFMPESISSVCAKNDFDFVMETARLAKQDEPSSAKKCFVKMLQNTYTLFVLRTSFVVLSRFCCGS